MKARLPTILSFAVAMAGCASINPFTYTAANILYEPHNTVCWGRVDTTNPANPCDDDQARISLDECVVELGPSVSLYTVEEEKREMLFECMFNKGWQKVFIVGMTLTSVRPTLESSRTDAAFGFGT